MVPVELAERGIEGGVPFNRWVEYEMPGVLVLAQVQMRCAFEQVRDIDAEIGPPTGHEIGNRDRLDQRAVGRRRAFR